MERRGRRGDERRKEGTDEGKGGVNGLCSRNFEVF